jgi:transcriptional regulator NrdR family protein
MDETTDDLFVKPGCPRCASRSLKFTGTRTILRGEHTIHRVLCLGCGKRFKLTDGVRGFFVRAPLVKADESL